MGCISPLIPLWLGRASNASKAEIDKVNKVASNGKNFWLCCAVSTKSLYVTKIFVSYARTFKWTGIQKSGSVKKVCAHETCLVVHLLRCAKSV